ncbi:MAG TPA: nicotinate-nucleotide--dimethylbenzimidazole phosphoribosyltransferase [Gaiellaceae bacterium]|nr:nicotinate-nucleotide--dimethylbenzimidazole phosphoribosyltransferase [Gaiellaceae bacterium]
MSGATLDALLARIGPVDAAAGRAAQDALDRKTKPRGSLGELERLACRMAAIRGTASPGRLRSGVVLAAGDHGYAARGVSAYPQEVTGQMLANFAAGGAAVNVLARETGAHLLVVDAGVASPVEHPEIRSHRLGPGTADATEGPAMTAEQALAGLATGAGLAEELAADGFGIVATGDMGIGNTTAAAAVCAALVPADPEAVSGRGTGIDDEGVARKAETVRRALAVNVVEPDDPVGVLAAVGGFELAVLAGVCLSAAAEGCVVLLDGFVTGAAALVAARLAPAAADRMVASHLSPEPGHALVLAELGLRPLLDLGLRLGEGSGALLALPLVDASLALLADMATFDAAGVTDAGA